jgi:cell division protein FtsQ
MIERTALPIDVRLMNGLSVVLVTLVLAALLFGLAHWIARLPVFALAGITVTGEVQHTNVVTLKANILPRLTGSFFTVDLQQTRQIFQQLPWTRLAVVEREFPNRLRVHIEEHRPVAFWGAQGDERLLNSHGEIFEPNLGELETDDLPRLSGPDNQSALVLKVYEQMQASFAAMGQHIALLELSPRGSWRVRTKKGAAIELGRGSLEDLQGRFQHFVETLPDVVSKWGRQMSALEAVDLRHENGYALKLRGVTTGDVKKTGR